MRELLWTTINDWLAHRTARSAAALAYYTTFSLAPLLLIAIGISGVVLGRDEARDRILEQATSLVGPAGAVAVENLMGTREAAPRAGLISAIVGLITLVVGAVGVVAQLKDSLNTVWDVDTSGGTWWALLRSYMTNMALVVGAGFLLLVSLIATALVSAATSTARAWLPGPDTMWVLVDGVIGFMMTAMVFALIFKVVPDTHVAWREVRVGAVVTALLFTLGRMALGAYLGRGGSSSAYGVAGSLLALLAWVYYSSQLVLLGAEFTHVHARHLRRVVSGDQP